MRKPENGQKTKHKLFGPRSTTHRFCARESVQRSVNVAFYGVCNLFFSKHKLMRSTIKCDVRTMNAPANEECHFGVSVVDVVVERFIIDGIGRLVRARAPSSRTYYKKLREETTSWKSSKRKRVSIILLLSFSFCFVFSVFLFRWNPETVIKIKEIHKRWCERRMTDQKKEFLNHIWRIDRGRSRSLSMRVVGCDVISLAPYFQNDFFLSKINCYNILFCFPSPLSPSTFIALLLAAYYMSIDSLHKL